MGISVDRQIRKMVATTLAVVFLATVFSGCTTLRKKFVRKHKEEEAKELEIPILQPEEYKPHAYSSSERYRMHYTLLKGYFSDLWDSLGRNDGDKRERYLLSQVAAKIDAMAQLLQEEKRSRLKELSEKVLTSMTELDKAGAMRRYDIMSSDLKTVENDIRRNFKPELVEQFFK